MILSLFGLAADSVYELNLQVNPTYLIETFETICDNQPLILEDET